MHVRMGTSTFKMSLNMKNINNFYPLEKKKGSVDVMFTCAITG